MFKVPNPFDEVVKKTTSEMLTTENWELIMEVCDRVGSDSEKAQQCFEVINERMLHRNANVVLYTMTLVQSLIENCSQNVKQQVSSRAFTTTLTRVLNDKAVHEKVKQRILGSIQQWAFDFRQDPTLSLMEETYTKLRAQRFHFPSPQKPEKIPKQSDLERQKEEDDLQLALALSLSSIGNGQAAEAQPSYQSPAAIRGEITRKQTVAASTGATTRRTNRASGTNQAAPSTDAPGKQVQVKALFDFVPTEAGELGFFKGDVITVLDQKYRDWWKGELRGKHGIFPANFVHSLGDIRTEVSKDIDAEVQVFSESHNIEALLRMLGSIDPMKSNVSDNEEIQRLYSSTWELRPKIIKLIEKYNQKKEELVKLDGQLSKSMRLYDELMQRSVSQSAYQGGYSGAGVQYAQPVVAQQPVAQQAGAQQVRPQGYAVSGAPSQTYAVSGAPSQNYVVSGAPSQNYAVSGAPQQMYYPQLQPQQSQVHPQVQPQQPQQPQQQFTPQMYRPQQPQQQQQQQQQYPNPQPPQFQN